MNESLINKGTFKEKRNGTLIFRVVMTGWIMVLLVGRVTATLAFEGLAPGWIYSEQLVEGRLATSDHC